MSNAPITEHDALPAEEKIRRSNVNAQIEQLRQARLELSEIVEDIEEDEGLRDEIEIRQRLDNANNGAAAAFQYLETLGEPDNEQAAQYRKEIDTLRNRVDELIEQYS